MIWGRNLLGCCSFPLYPSIIGIKTEKRCSPWVKFTSRNKMSAAAGIQRKLFLSKSLHLSTRHKFSQNVLMFCNWLRIIVLFVQLQFLRITVHRSTKVVLNILARFQSHFWNKIAKRVSVFVVKLTIVISVVAQRAP